ncbi:hypothetical protein AAG570_013315 [Ranatra chinensis]|uniref:CYTH domain-containing protein n=1 Tax=Ranatra chinensis TaxID=642074 RepID=A0ABD0YSW6_9HEMI
MSEILRNIEIKAKLNDQARAIEKCRELARVDGELIHQVDYFFNVEKGRLKLRFMGGQSAELIFYERPNSEGPKLCKYEKCKIEDGKILLNILKNVLGIRGVVKKTRNLYLIGQTRVHIDEVVDLGNYLEFEVLNLFIIFMYM